MPSPDVVLSACHDHQTAISMPIPGRYDGVTKVCRRDIGPPSRRLVSQVGIRVYIRAGGKRACEPCHDGHVTWARQDESLQFPTPVAHFIAGQAPELLPATNKRQRPWQACQLMFCQAKWPCSVWLFLSLSASYFESCHPRSLGPFASRRVRLYDNIEAPGPRANMCTPSSFFGGLGSGLVLWVQFWAAASYFPSRFVALRVSDRPSQARGTGQAATRGCDRCHSLGHALIRAAMRCMRRDKGCTQTRLQKKWLLELMKMRPREVTPLGVAYRYLGKVPRWLIVPEPWLKVLLPFAPPASQRAPAWPSPPFSFPARMGARPSASMSHCPGAFSLPRYLPRRLAACLQLIPSPPKTTKVLGRGPGWSHPHGQWSLPGILPLPFFLISEGRGPPPVALCHAALCG